MFFQFSPPQRKPSVQKVPPSSTTEEVEVLSLAPFTRNPKLSFDGITVGTKAWRNLLIQNPSNQDIQITVHSDFCEEVELSWTENVIEKKSECKLVIAWTPSKPGGWRHMLHLSDGNKIQRDVPVVFKSSNPKNIKTNKSKTSKCLPKFKTKSPISNKRKSPVKSPKKRPVLPNITNIPNIFINGQEEVEESVSKMEDNKENFNFKAGPTVHFNLENDVFSRRDTYTVQKMVKIKSDAPASPNFVDSLEMDTSPRKSEASSDIAAKLESMSFNFSPVTPQRDLSDFKPDCCSTEEKSHSNTSYFASNFMTTETNSTFEVMKEVEQKVNISTETYVKGNISAETYVKEDLSTETYIKGNLSTETYVKDNISSETYTVGDVSSSTFLKENSLNDLENLQFSPLVQNNTVEFKSPKLLVDKFFESSLRTYRDFKQPLSCIKEESWCSDTFSSTSKKSNVTFDMTPKKSNLGISDWSRKGGTAFGVSKKTTGLNVDAKIENGGKLISVTNTKEVKVKDPFLLAAINDTIDPFVSTSVYYDVEWMDQQQENFKKWLNALLTPNDLKSNEENHVDIQKIWQQCKTREVPVAPSKELVSSQYHTNSKLNALRKSAMTLFKSEEIRTVLSDVMAAVDNDKLTIRQDRDIHLDLFLQSEIMSTLLSYNSLWLRIGLETIYNVVIPMTCNSDMMALSRFILERFFKDPYLIRKHKSVHSVRYCKDIKKFILKKFLTLVYFLDKAKMRKLFRHDPCLFRKKSELKESREVLLKFAREALLAIGDLTKYLKHFGYEVFYKQTYLDEYNYAVTTLGVDLRDGVRLTKVAEIILLRNNLSKNLRVPAISRLQKIHNVKVVFDSLQEAGFEICSDISPKDIVDGHKEKTLSFLWQIIHKFQTPLMMKCATTIQQWWRSVPVIVKRRELRKIYEEKNNAAKKIQSWYRKRLFLRKLKQSIELRRRHKAATVIQSYFRMYKSRKEFLNLRNTIIQLQRRARRWLASEERARNLAAIKIQSYFRMFIARQRFLKLKYSVLLLEEKYLANKYMRLERERYETLKYMTIRIQNMFRANRCCKQIRAEYVKLKTTVIFVQQRYRAIICGRKVRAEFIAQRNAAIVIQQRYRTYRIMKQQREEFMILREATVTIQRRYRATLEMRKQLTSYQKLRNAAITIQRRFRATLEMRKQLTSYQKMRQAAITIQRRFRAYRIMKQQREEFMTLKMSTIAIQRRFRATLQMRKQLASYQKMRQAAITIQRHFRAYLIMKKQREEFITLRMATITIQRRFRATLEMRKQLTSYQQMRYAAITIQRRYRAFKIMKKQREEFITLRMATLTIQRRYRATLEMRKQLTSYQKMRQAAVTIQRRFRAYRIMKQQRQEFITLKMATITIQRRFTATLEMRKQLASYQKMKQAAITIQRHFRAYLIMKKQREEFITLRMATITIQRRFRATLEMRKQLASYQRLRNATITIQRHFRATLEMRKQLTSYQKMRHAAITIQRHFRAYIIMKQQREEFITLKMATITIQRRFRATLEMREQLTSYQRLRNATITIQRRFRATIEMRKQLTSYQKMRQAAITIQRRFRAYRIMKQQREEFITLKMATITIQRRFRATLEMREQFISYQRMKNAAIVIQRYYRNYLMVKKLRAENRRKLDAIVVVQKYVRRFLVLKKYGEYLKPEAIRERRRQREAATKIQAAWRGYRSRSLDKPEMIEIRKNLQIATENALPQNTLGSRCKQAVILLTRKPTVSDIIAALKDIEFVTRRCRDTCLKMSSTITRNLYATITSTNRSPAEMEVCTIAAHILIDFYRYPASRKYSFIGEYMEKVITLMLHWCDKEAPLFPTLCTLMWLFCHTNEYKQVILESPNFWQKMSKMESLCARKEKMVSKSNNKVESVFCRMQNLPLPSVLPDWGLELPNRPKVFCNSLKAFKCLLNMLNQ